MTEQEALSKSTGFVNIGGLIGHLPFRPANFLVCSGRYEWHQCCTWGYIVKRKAAVMAEGEDALQSDVKRARAALARWEKASQ